MRNMQLIVQRKIFANNAFALCEVDDMIRVPNLLTFKYVPYKCFELELARKLSYG